MQFDDEQMRAIQTHATRSGLSPEDYLWGLHLRAAEHAISGRKGFALLSAAQWIHKEMQPIIEELACTDLEIVQATQSLASALKPYRRGK